MKSRNFHIRNGQLEHFMWAVTISLRHDLQNSNFLELTNSCFSDTVFIQMFLLPIRY